MSFLYVASPYSAPDAQTRQERFERVQHFTAWLLMQKIWAYSPIMHCHQMAVAHELPKDAAFWWDYNRTLINASKGLIVFCDAGWRESVGVTQEIEYAAGIGKPVQWVKMTGDGYKFLPGPPGRSTDLVLPMIAREFTRCVVFKLEPRKPIEPAPVVKTSGSVFHIAMPYKKDDLSLPLDVFSEKYVVPYAAAMWKQLPSNFSSPDFWGVPIDEYKDERFDGINTRTVMQVVPAASFPNVSEDYIYNGSYYNGEMDEIVENVPVVSVILFAVSVAAP